MSAPLVSAQALHTYYGPSHVLHGVDLEIQRGETVALMGRNGMGKTTLLRSLMGLTPPKRGRVMIDGVDMTGAPTHAVARAGLALVPEGRGVFPSLTVREHLVMAARPARKGRSEWTLARVLETFPRLAERLDLGGARLSRRPPHTLPLPPPPPTHPPPPTPHHAT